VNAESPDRGSGSADRHCLSLPPLGLFVRATFAHLLKRAGNVGDLGGHSFEFRLPLAEPRRPVGAELIIGGVPQEPCDLLAVLRVGVVGDSTLEAFPVGVHDEGVVAGVRDDRAHQVGHVAFAAPGIEDVVLAYAVILGRQEQGEDRDAEGDRKLSERLRVEPATVPAFGDRSLRSTDSNLAPSAKPFAELLLREPRSAPVPGDVPGDDLIHGDLAARERIGLFVIHGLTVARKVTRGRHFPTRISEALDIPVRPWQLLYRPTEILTTRYRWANTTPLAPEDTPMNQLEMTREELLALPVSVDLVTAGRAFGIGRTVAFELARTGQFPCRVLRVGVKYRVPRSAIFEALGVDETALADSREPDSAA
jgi:hypothetical protein